jgi:hypothetical protein
MACSRRTVGGAPGRSPTGGTRPPRLPVSRRAHGARQAYRPRRARRSRPGGRRRAASSDRGPS